MSAAADQISATSTTASAKACGAFWGRLWGPPEQPPFALLLRTPQAHLSVIILARLSLVFRTCCLDHFPDLVFDLIGWSHRVELILGEAQLGEHPDSCIDIKYNLTST
jgi:hypothetical protein